MTDIATQRFTNSEKFKDGIQYGVHLIMYDLKNGKCGFTGKPLPNFSGLNFSTLDWKMLERSTVNALIYCTKEEISKRSMPKESE